MPFGPAQLDAPPPSPVTSPPAARESTKLGMLTGGAPPMPGAGGSGGMPGMGSSAPDLSGVMALGQKIDEALLALADVMPESAGQFDQARELVANGVASYLQKQGSTPGVPGVPGGTAGMPRGDAASNQFPGGGFGQGRVA